MKFFEGLINGILISAILWTIIISLCIQIFCT